MNKAWAVEKGLDLAETQNVTGLWSALWEANFFVQITFLS